MAATDNNLMTREIEVKQDYAASINEVNSQFAAASKKISDMQTGIASQLLSNQKVNEAAYNTVNRELNTQVANIANVNQAQVASAAQQLDAMTGAGKFGGNLYRSMQVYSGNLTNIITSGLTAMTNTVLQYRTAAESMRAEFSNRNLQAFISGANTIMSASIELAKSYAQISSEMTVNKNKQLNDIASMQIEIDTASLNAETQKAISAQNNATQLQVAQMNSMTSVKIARMNYDAEMAKLESDRLISERNNQVSIYLGDLQARTSTQIAQLDAATRTAINNANIKSTELINANRNQLDRDLALMKTKADEAHDRREIEASKALAKLQADYNMKIEQLRIQAASSESDKAIRAQQQIEQLRGSYSMAQQEIALQRDAQNRAAELAYRQASDAAKIQFETWQQNVKTSLDLYKFNVEQQSDAATEAQFFKAKQIELSVREKSSQSAKQSVSPEKTAETISASAAQSAIAKSNDDLIQYKLLEVL